MANRRYVHPGQSQVIGRDRRDYKAMNTATAGISIAGFDTAPRQHAADGSAKEAKKTFKDLRGTFTEEQMKIETSRCLGCGATVVDENKCIGCGLCTTAAAQPAMLRRQSQSSSPRRSQESKQPLCTRSELSAQWSKPSPILRAKRH